MRILTAAAIFGIILTAAYLLWMFQKVFYGNMLPKWKNFHDATPHEVFILLSLILVIVVFGFYPQGLTSIFVPTVDNILSLI
jgi:NADH-quinone oxidoreductase subunit M